MASAENVKNITGFSIGGVSPIGHLIKIDILIDKSLMRFDILYAAAGHPNCVFKTNFDDLQKRGYKIYAKANLHSLKRRKD